MQSRYYDPKIGRFINADSLVSTGQSVQGYNMFAYCNNNPVNSIDTVGCAPSKYFFAVCLGGTSASPGFVGTTDGSEESQKLLQYIIDTYDINWEPFYGNTVHISVEASGVYEKPSTEWVDWAIFSIGTGIFFVNPPVSNYISLGLQSFSLVSMVAKKHDPLPNSEYYQYSVKMTWTTTTAQYGASTLTTHYIVQTYIWNDTKKREQYWHLLDSDHTSNSVTFYP